MTIKDELIKKLARDFDIPENVIASVVTHQFDSAHAATEKNNSIEISGFGTFNFNQKRANKQMDKYKAQILLFSGALNNETLSPGDVRGLQMRLATVESNIKHLKPKIHEAE